MSDKIARLKSLHNSIFDRYYQVAFPKLFTLPLRMCENAFSPRVSKTLGINKSMKLFADLVHEKYYHLDLHCFNNEWFSHVIAYI